MEHRSRSQRELIKDEAAQWVARLSDPACDAQTRAAFEVWRDADPAREAAFERESATWEALDRLRALRPANPAPDPDLLAPHRKPAPRPVIRWVSAACGAVAFVSVGALLVNSFSSTAYATGVGERRVIVLSDGSRVELNTDSKIVVHFHRGVRQVDLVRGEAVFNVGAGDGPFVVHTSAGDFKTLGSDLAVRLGPAGARLIVRRGVVRLDSEPRLQTVALNAAVAGGHEVTLVAGTARQAPVAPEDVDRALAWRQGFIALNGQSLAEAVGEINRYNTTKIVIGDPRIAGFRLAGYFSTYDEAGFAAAVSHAFPVKSAVMSDGTLRLSRKD